MKSRILLSLSASMMLAGTASADVFSGGTGGAIPDSTTSNLLGAQGIANFTLNVASSGTIASFDSLTINGFAHTWVGDLQVLLIAPNGDDTVIFSRLGNTTATGFGNSNDLSGNYTFVTSGGTALPTTGLMPAGTYNRGGPNPNAAVVQTNVGDLDAFSVFNGDNVNGIWTLRIMDFANGDVGNITGWSFNATIPGPGSLALLGLAGLVGRGRRRS
jgi:uncharacterized protein (TIGR03382 family)